MPDPEGSSSGRPAFIEAEPAFGVEIGALIAGKYRVDRVIGKGGMGVVVAASQLALERTVAIKLMRSDVAEEPAATQRLLREAKAAASIQSEHVAKVLDVGTLDSGAPFIVMEFLDGSDLQTLIERDGPLRASDAVDYLLQACEAIAEAHRNGIVHRDIKPANLFIARLPGGRTSVKVVDFGISKAIGRGAAPPLTQPSNVVGSLYHMAPEQMRAGHVDARTDVWALGLVLFELLTGRKPFGNQSLPAVAAQVLSDAGPLLAVPMDGIGEELQAVIQKCVRRQPEERYGNVAELAVALSPFGSRRAHVSLERIVLLATSTGSLSALAFEPTAPVAARPPVDATRPVRAPGFAAADMPALASPATPFPVSSSPPPQVAPSRLPLLLGLAGGSALALLALVWSWRRAPEPPATPQGAPASEQRSAPSPTGAGVPRVEALPGEGAPHEGAVRTVPNAAEAPPASSRAAATPEARRPAMAAATGSSAEARPPRAPAPPPATSEAPPRAPTPDGPARPEGPPASEPEAGSSEAKDAPIAPRAAPLEPNTKPPSPWDLRDIEFRDEAAR